MRRAARIPGTLMIVAGSGHRIVTADDLSVLRSRHEEQLVLQACHPRLFAKHRYLAYAKLVHVEPREGQPYDVGAAGPIA